MSAHAYNLRNGGSFHEFCEAADYLERLERELAETQAELAYARSMGDECALEVRGWKEDAAFLPDALRLLEKLRDDTDDRVSPGYQSEIAAFLDAMASETGDEANG